MSNILKQVFVGLQKSAVNQNTTTAISNAVAQGSSEQFNSAVTRLLTGYSQSARSNSTDANELNSPTTVTQSSPQNVSSKLQSSTPKQNPRCRSPVDTEKRTLQNCATQIQPTASPQKAGVQEFTQMPLSLRQCFQPHAHLTMNPFLKAEHNQSNQFASPRFQPHVQMQSEGLAQTSPQFDYEGVSNNFSVQNRTVSSMYTYKPSGPQNVQGQRFNHTTFANQQTVSQIKNMYYSTQEEACQDTGAAEPYFVPLETREEISATSGAAGQNTQLQGQLFVGMNGKRQPHSTIDTETKITQVASNLVDQNQILERPDQIQATGSLETAASGKVGASKKQFGSKEEMGKYIEGFKVKYKTEICKNWRQTGKCEFKNSCSFAHGSHELKQKTDIHKNYKTKQCKRFHKDGYCPYGERCQFLHDEAPTKHSNAQASTSQETSLKKNAGKTSKVKGNPRANFAGDKPAAVHQQKSQTADKATCVSILTREQDNTETAADVLADQAFASSAGAQVATDAFSLDLDEILDEALTEQVNGLVQPFRQTSVEPSSKTLDKLGQTENFPILSRQMQPRSNRLRIFEQITLKRSSSASSSETK